MYKNGSTVGVPELLEDEDTPDSGRLVGHSENIDCWRRIVGSCAADGFRDVVGLPNLAASSGFSVGTILARLRFSCLTLFSVFDEVADLFVVDELAVVE